MATGPSGGSEHIKVTWSSAYPSVYTEATKLTPEEVKRMIADFQQGVTPLTVPQEPSIAIDFEKAQQSLMQQQEINDKIAPKPENQIKRENLKGKMGEVEEFIKKHPFLAGGFLIALVLLGVCAYLTIASLFGHATIALFQAHPVLGGGITFMLLYYSVYLINLCRRAALKDDLQAKVEEYNKAAEQMEKTQKFDAELEKEMKARINNLSQSYLAAEQKMRTMEDYIKRQYQTALDSLDKLKSYKEGLLELQSRSAKLDPEDRKDLQKAIKKASAAIEKGMAEVGFEKFPTVGDLPQIPQIELTSTAITIPPIETENMKRNKPLQQSLKEKLGEVLNGISSYLKNNPGAVGLILTGLVVCSLSGLALGFYFHGATSLFFFGTLGLTTIVPILIYGLSLIFEGYNNATINALRDSLDKMEKNQEERKRAIVANQKRLNEISTQSDQTFDAFTKNWANLSRLETTLLAEHITEVENVNIAGLSNLEGMCEATLRLLGRQVQRESLYNAYTQPAIGARLLATPTQVAKRPLSEKFI